MSSYRTSNTMGNVSENKSSRSRLWPAVLGGGLVGASGVAGAAIGRLTDPFKKYEGTTGSVALADPAKLKKLRLGMLRRSFEEMKGLDPQAAVALEVALDRLSAGKPLPSAVLTELDRGIHMSGIIPALREGRMLRGGAIGLGAGLGALGTAALIKKLRSRKSSSVGRVVPSSH